MLSESFSGRATYHTEDKTSLERAATLDVRYELSEGKLRGYLYFRGHEAWRSTFDIEDAFDAMPEPWELKAFVREHLRQCMHDRHYVYHSSDF